MKEATKGAAESGAERDCGDRSLDDALNTVIAALRGTEAARILADSVGGGIERLRSALDSERALCRKMTAEYSASRVGIMAMVGELHGGLLMAVRHFEHGAELDHDWLAQAKGALARTRPNAPSWENARGEVQGLLLKAAEVPGLSAALDEARWERDGAVRLLHMVDCQEARHPDIAAFLDDYEARHSG